MREILKQCTKKECAKYGMILGFSLGFMVATGSAVLAAELVQVLTRL